MENKRIKPVYPARSYNPEDLMVLRMNEEEAPIILEDGEPDRYLDVKALVLLFREAFPNGAILAEEPVFDAEAGLVSVTANVFNDVENPRPSSSSTCVLTYTDSVYAGNWQNAVRSCESLAKRQALIDDGIGTNYVLMAEQRRREAKMAAGADKAAAMQQEIDDLNKAAESLFAGDDSELFGKIAERVEARKTEPTPEPAPAPEEAKAEPAAEETEEKPKPKKRTRKAKVKAEPAAAPAEPAQEEPKAEAPAEPAPEEAKEDPAPKPEDVKSADEPKADEPQPEEPKPEETPSEEAPAPADNGGSGDYIVQEDDFLLNRYNVKYAGQSLKDLDPEMLHYVVDMPGYATDRLIEEIRKFLGV